MPSEHEIHLTDKEFESIQIYAYCGGISEEEAATKLFSDAMAKRYHSGFHRPPATVYDIKTRSIK